MTTPDATTLTLDGVPDATKAVLTDFIDSRRPQINRIGAPVTEAVGHLEDFVLGGGKRVRPMYGWAGFIGAGGLENSAEDPAAVLKAVSSLEFIQACALIHDDIIDSSDTRRGKPTVHRAVESGHDARAWHGDGAHFGSSVAVLIGDLALVWAEDLYREAGVSNEGYARAQEAWAGMRTEVIGGQLLDIYLEADSNEDADMAEAVNRFKTAAYTIERPLHLGAALAGAGDDLINSFRGYGRDIGIAYQLRDDQLGVFGDPEITGKPAGDDLREGKRTVLLATALQRADAQDKAAAAELRRGVGQVSAPEDIARLADIIAETGAPEAIEEKITAFTDSGLSYLEDSSVPSHVAESLRDMAIRSTARRA